MSERALFVSDGDLRHENRGLRPWRDTWWLRLARGVRRLQQRADWHRFAGPAWPDRIMSVTVTDQFHAKQGRSTGRLVLRHGKERLAVYLKRHYRVSWWRGLLAVVCPDAGWSPAVQEWRHLQWARARGLPVPAAVAAGEFIGPWGRLQSFLAVEELAGMAPLHEAVPAAAARLAPPAFELWKRRLTADLARFVRELHRRRYFHKDLYLCHFFVPGWSGPVAGVSDSGYTSTERVHLIDLHRFHKHRWTWRFWQVKDLAQLLYSSEIPALSVRDRVRFWRTYVGAGQCRALPVRWLRWCVMAKWRRYRRHNLKHRR
jgi:heptose I phosphotransferase